MTLPIGPVIGILADNLRLRGSVLPIPARRSTSWARQLGLPVGGPTVLYSGQMVQLIPYIEAMVAIEERLGGSPLARLAPLGRRLNRVVSLVPLMARPPGRAVAEYDRILVDVATLLSRAGVAFGALYADDLYTGALAHDLGADEAVAVQARRIQQVLRRYKVREVITVDPHTTHMLRTVFPRILPDFAVAVRSYLEVLAERPLAVPAPLPGVRTLHDACVFARYESVVEEPRRLLAQTGLRVLEPEAAGRLTECCGGPAESLFPARARAIAGQRVAQLRRAAPDAITMCPLCLVNLRRAADGALGLEDISSVLRRATGG